MLNPNEAHSELCMLYYHLGLEEPAIRALQRAFETDPDNQTVLTRFIERYALLGRYDETIAANAHVFNRVGPLALLWKNRLEDAGRAVDEGLARNPNDLNMKSARARLLALKGEFQPPEAIHTQPSPDATSDAGDSGAGVSPLKVDRIAFVYGSAVHE